MATTKERILISLAPSTARALRERALRERTPRATIAARFVELGLIDVPTVTLSPAGERKALLAIRAYKRAKAAGTLKVLKGSLIDLL